jgi:hypothetical protein
LGAAPATIYRRRTPPPPARLSEAEHGRVGERRAQREHRAYARPELLAERPNEVYSWDITKLKGPAKWTYYQLYRHLPATRPTLPVTALARAPAPLAPLALGKDLQAGVRAAASSSALASTFSGTVTIS